MTNMITRKLSPNFSKTKHCLTTCINEAIEAPVRGYKRHKGGTNQQWIITGEPSNSAAPNPSQARRQHLNHSIITSCHSSQWKHWDRKMGDSSGRQAGNGCICLQQATTCFYMPFYMHRLRCSVCTFQHFLTCQGTWKQRGSYEVLQGWYIENVE